MEHGAVCDYSLATSNTTPVPVHMVAPSKSETKRTDALRQHEIDALKLAVQKLSLKEDGKIDATQLGALCRQTEGRVVPFDRIHTALSEIRPVSKGELSRDEFIKFIAFLRGKVYEAGNATRRNTTTTAVTTASAATPTLGQSSERKILRIPQTQRAQRITRIAGSTASTSHSLDHDELEQFALHLSDVARDDCDLKNRPAVTAETFFVSCRDGLLLSKLINRAVPETIDERVLNVGAVLNPFQMTENINVAINSAKAIGCSVVNIGAVDVLEGREHLILGLVWQVIKAGLLAKISLQFHPELKRLLQDGETLEQFLRLPADAILLRWFNYQLRRAGTGRTVGNFADDLVDGECYLHLLHVLAPGQCPKAAALRETDVERRAEQVVENARAIGCDQYVSVNSIVRANHRLNLAFVANLFNHFPGLEQLSAQEMAELAKLDEQLFRSEGDRESRTFALWMNSLGVDPFVHALEDDLRDGRVLLQVLDFIEPTRAAKKPGVRARLSIAAPTRFQALENTNAVVEQCRALGFSLVGIQGADVTDGNRKLTLALVWQLMRQHIVATLRGLTRNGRDVTDDDMISWANGMVQRRGMEIETGQDTEQDAQDTARAPAQPVRPISSFKDASLATGRFLLELLAAINGSVVNFELVTAGEREEDARANAKYAISVARKLGASIFLLPEDIVQVRPKMLLTFIGTLMAIYMRQSLVDSVDVKEETAVSEQ